MVFKLTVSSERSLGGGHGGPGGGGEHVLEQLVRDVPGDSPALGANQCVLSQNKFQCYLIGDPDGDITRTLGDHHLNLRKF